MWKKIQNILFIEAFLFLVIVNTAYAQEVITSLITDTHINIAPKKFKSPLLVEVKIPKGETTMKLKISFPEGIVYEDLKIDINKKTSVNVVKTNNSTTKQPVFIITANPEESVKFSVYRRFTKAVKANTDYRDVVEAFIGEKLLQQRESATYQLKFPQLKLALDPVVTGVKGENERKFSVKNFGDGAIKEFYLSIQYPHNIKNINFFYSKDNKNYSLTPEKILLKKDNTVQFLYKINATILQKDKNNELFFSKNMK